VIIYADNLFGLVVGGPPLAFLFSTLSALEVFHSLKALPDFLQYFDVML